VRTLLRIPLFITTLFCSIAYAADITHAMGKTTVPDHPTRVVVLTNEGTEAIISLGVMPVGAANSWVGKPWYPHLMDVMVDVEPVGKESGVNLELIAALEPDLILGNKTRHEKIYTQLSAIAPTVYSERLRGDWRINYQLYADALNKSELGKQRLAEYDQQVEDLSVALGDSIKEEVSVIRFLASQIRIYQLDSFSGVLLSQLGFARPEIQNVDSFAIKTGKESIPDMDGDRIFYFTYESGDGEGLAAEKEILADPLWNKLSAVQAGKLHGVDDSVWNTAGGILAARLMLEDIKKIYQVSQ
jgi:iron complex transport system substrate-binding protein